ncbi:MAG TPA: YlcI/YnfO family protein [Kribbellaceae bacterium]|nr:YlcI/YnfO family protein [Kribbellaceae bacterium]
MSKQIAVRLPDDLVAFIDHVVESGEASSRAAVVMRALEHERRRDVAARDAAILRRVRSDRDFDRLAEYASRTPLDDLG